MKHLRLPTLVTAVGTLCMLGLPLLARGDDNADKRRFTADLKGFNETPSIAHIQLGQRHTAGGVSTFFCGGGGKPPCPPQPATITGTIDATGVLGPVPQGIAPGELAELIRAIRAGATYANAHTPTFPAGEIRGQIGHRHE